jgi:hypothetical protein
VHHWFKRRSTRVKEARDKGGGGGGGGGDDDDNNNNNSRLLISKSLLEAMYEIFSSYLFPSMIITKIPRATIRNGTYRHLLPDIPLLIYLKNITCLDYVIRVFTLRRMRWVEHVAHMGKMRIGFNILVFIYLNTIISCLDYIIRVIK